MNLTVMCKSAIVAELDLGVYVCDGVGLGVTQSTGVLSGKFVNLMQN